MAMYYPQDTTLNMGPTGVLPGTQYNSLPGETNRHLKSREIPAAWDTSEVAATCTAGTVVLIHYDLWHAGLENYSTDPSHPRFMFKFQFVRMEEPTGPSWQVGHGGPSPWLPEHSPNKTLTPLYQDVWDWMCGRRVDSSEHKWPSDQHRQEAVAALSDNTLAGEVGRLAAAYALAQKGELLVLLRGFTSNEECVVRASAYGLIAAARHSRVEAIAGIVDHLKSSTKKLQATVPAYAVFALGEIGSHEAVKPLSKLLIHVKDISAKRAMAKALGNLPPGAESFIVPALLKLSAERDDQIRFQAVLSLAKAAGALSPALHPDLVSPVVRALANFVTLDNNRYVQAYALEGLKRLRTCPEAQDLLIRILMSQRWCPITTKASAF